ncbi:MAG TPA: ABC transporter permease, partial [Thermoanaerobaculia bacterium]|nr:ABC transporter permease [Thermoanaerobaculia bacterium]
MSQLAADLRLAVRALVRRPGLTAVAVATLALGIGANTAIFSAVDRILLAAPPVAEPERVVALTSVFDGNDTPVSLPDLLDWKRELRSLSGLAAFRGSGFSIGGDEGAAEHVGGAMASADFFTLLGVQPLLGSVFAPVPGEPPADRLPATAGGEDVAVLGHDLWQRRFGGDPAVIGRTIRLDREPYTVIGVLRDDGLRMPWAGEIEVWVPYSRFQERFLDRGIRSNTMGIGRLAPGTTVEAAAAELTALAARQEELHPENNRAIGAALAPLHDKLVRDGRTMLLIVQAVVLLVLAIACVNLANLLLARTHARGQELAVRRAMGAGRGRLVRQLLVESVVLGLTGGAAGVLVGAWGIEGLALLGGDGSALEGLALDGRVLAVAMGLSVACGLLAGLLPALAGGRAAEALSDGGARTAGGGLRARR